MKIWWRFSLNHGGPENDPKLFFQKKRPHADKWVCAWHRFPTIKEKKFNLLLLLILPSTRRVPPSRASVVNGQEYKLYQFFSLSVWIGTRRATAGSDRHRERILHFLNLLRSDTRICRTIISNVITYARNDFFGLSGRSERWWKTRSRAPVPRKLLLCTRSKQHRMPLCTPCRARWVRRLWLNGPIRRVTYVLPEIHHGLGRRGREKIKSCQPYPRKTMSLKLKSLFA